MPPIVHSKLNVESEATLNCSSGGTFCIASTIALDQAGGIAK